MRQTLVETMYSIRVPSIGHLLAEVTPVCDWQGDMTHHCQIHNARMTQKEKRKKRVQQCVPNY